MKLRLYHIFLCLGLVFSYDVRAAADEFADVGAAAARDTERVAEEAADRADEVVTAGDTQAAAKAVGNGASDASQVSKVGLEGRTTAPETDPETDPAAQEPQMSKRIREKGMKLQEARTPTADPSLTPEADPKAATKAELEAAAKAKLEADARKQRNAIIKVNRNLQETISNLRQSDAGMSKSLYELVKEKGTALTNKDVVELQAKVDGSIDTSIADIQKKIDALDGNENILKIKDQEGKNILGLKEDEGIDTIEKDNAKKILEDQKKALEKQKAQFGNSFTKLKGLVDRGDVSSETLTQFSKDTKAIFKEHTSALDSAEFKVNLTIDKYSSGAMSTVLGTAASVALRGARGIKAFASDLSISGLKDMIVGGAHFMLTAVAFMIPNLFQSAYTAKVAQVAQLTSIASPVEFAGMVFQIPTSCINIANPEQSVFVYVVVPVSHVGQAPDASLDGLVAGPLPSSKDSLVKAVQGSIGSTIMSMGANLSISLSRYHLSPEYLLKEAVFAVTYSSQGMFTPGSVPMTSSQFSGELLILNTGQIVNAAGQQVNVTGLEYAQSLPMISNLVFASQYGQQNMSTASEINSSNLLDSVLPLVYARALLAGDKETFTQFISSGATKGASVSDAVLSRLDIKNLAQNGSATSPCYAAVKDGLSCQSYNFTNLIGAVLPLKGWGSKGLGELLDLGLTAQSGFGTTKFPFFDLTADVNTQTQFMTLHSLSAGADTINTSSDQQGVEVWLSDKNNCVAQGCWIYRSRGTAIAKQALAKAIEIGCATKADSYNDIIVFLDSSLSTIVPLMVPGIKQVTLGSSSYQVPGMVLNPSAHYYVSLIELALNVQNGPSSINAYTLDGRFGTSSALMAPQGKSGVPLLQTIVQSFLPEPLTALNDQINYYSNAMLSLLGVADPIKYGKQKLILLPNPAFMVPPKSSPATTPGLQQPPMPINAYTGISCVGSVVDDYWLIVSNYNASSFKPDFVTLQGNETTSMYALSLVTDVVFKYEPKTQTWSPYDYKESVFKLDASHKPIVSKDGSYQFVDTQKDLESNYFVSALTGSGATISSGLLDHIKNLRKEWILSAGAVVEIDGFSVALAPGLKRVNALKNNQMVYGISPNPSVIMDDMFIASPVAAPTLQSLKVGRVDQAQAWVSVITGAVYDTSFNPVLNKSGEQVFVQAGAWVTKFYAALDAVLQTATLPQPFGAKLKEKQKSYAQEQSAIAKSYSFAGFELNLRLQDAQDGNYVYFTGTAEEMTCFYVVYDPVTNSIGSELDASTKYIVDLISGITLSEAGPVGQVQDAELTKMLSGYKKNWNSWLLSEYDAVKKGQVAVVAADKAQQKALDQALNSFAQKEKSAATVSTAAATSIARLEQLTGVYAKLWRDPVTKGLWYRSPASVNVAKPAYIYLDLATGKVYNEQGMLVHKYSEAELDSTRAFYGVGVNKSGQTYLAIPLFQPALYLPMSDQALKLGASGSVMISSSSVDYAGQVPHVASGYNLYFNTVLGIHMLYDGTHWYSLDGNHRYEKNGSTSISKHKVYRSGLNFVLLTHSSTGYPQGFVSKNDTAYINELGVQKDNSMTWKAVNGSGMISVIFGQNVLTVESDTYTLDTNLYHAPMLNVSINGKGEYKNDDPILSTGSLLMNVDTNEVEGMVFGGDFYKVTTTQANNVYILKSMSNGNVISVTSELVDPSTKAMFIKVQSKKQVYRYAFVPAIQSRSRAKDFRANIACGTEFASAESLQYGPFKSVSESAPTNSAVVVTEKLPRMTSNNSFASDITIATLKPVVIADVQNAPTTKDPAVYTEFSLGLQSVLQTDDNRYVVPLSSLNQPDIGLGNSSYVDLYNGALYDAKTGKASAVGLTLQPFLTMLDNLGLGVMVSRTDKGVETQLYYRCLAVSTSMNQKAIDQAESAQAA